MQQDREYGSHFKQQIVNKLDKKQKLCSIMFTNGSSDSLVGNLCPYIQ